jgi:hypothetical protein
MQIYLITKTPNKKKNMKKLLSTRSIFDSKLPVKMSGEIDTMFFGQ